MQISEIFHSIQGEGILAGQPSAFIRTTGCNLRCTWCDTPYTSWVPEGVEKSIRQIVAEIGSQGVTHVVITGGEPMIAAGIRELCDSLKHRDYHVTIETAGTVYEPVPCDLASISPKLSNSTPWDRDANWAPRHEQLRINLDAIRAFMTNHDYQLKFVVDQPEDLAEIITITQALEVDDTSRILLMPQGISAEALSAKTRWLAEICKKHNFRLSPRWHIDIYGNARGT
jgi:7-carboxy-7-deazaguanine synthase